jgi:hypothetical protein
MSLSYNISFNPPTKEYAHNIIYQSLVWSYAWQNLASGDRASRDCTSALDVGSVSVVPIAGELFTFRSFLEYVELAQ